MSQRTKRLGIALALASMTMAVTPSFAATLGGVKAQSLTALSQTANAPSPTIVAWENFDGVNATGIAGTVTDGGAKKWIAPRCTWTLNSNRAQTTNADCTLIIDAGVVADSAEVTLVRNASTVWDSGLLLRSNAAATVFLTAEYTSVSNGSLELWRYNGTWTALGRITGLYPSGVKTAPASVVVRVEAPTPTAPATVTTIRCLLDGAVKLSVALSAADQASFSTTTQTYAGPYAYFDATTGFDNFHVETP